MSLTLHYDFASDKSLAARKGPTLSITRATNGTYRDSSGTIQTAGSGVARFDHDASGNSLGLLVEEARTNLALYNTDTSNAAWVASNVTKESTSVTTPDGASSTTVRLTASAGNGTLLQSVTSASATRAYSVYMRRVTGTGDIDLTVDGGSTWTTKTLTSEWQRFDITQAAVTNPQFGVRIVTSGDAIDFWASQLETGAFPTSLIYPTTTASVTRNADNVDTTDLSWLNTDAGTFYAAAQWNPEDNGQANIIFELNDNSSSDRYLLYKGITTGRLDLDFISSAGNNADINGAGVVSSDTLVRAVVGFAENDVALYADGSYVGTDSTFVPTSNLLTLDIGQNYTNGNPTNGHIAEIRYWDERWPDNVLEEISNGDFSSTESSLQERRRHIIKRRRANAALAQPRKELWAGRPVNNPKYR